MDIDAETLLLASLGKPNRASLAPVLYNAGFNAIGLNYKFVVFEPDDIEAGMQAIRTFKMPGVSVTKPYKQAIMPYLDEIDPVAQAIGAVNAVRNDNGHLTGYNCDWIGVVEALEEGTELQGKRVAVLGAGGAARAAVYGLIDRKAVVTVFNRTADRGQQLADELGVTFGSELDKVATQRPDILVNATSISMDNGGFVPVEAAVFETARVVMDVVNKPRQTALLAAAAQHGCTVVEGIRMLTLQASFAFKLFTGKDAPLDIMFAAVVAALK